MPCVGHLLRPQRLSRTASARLLNARRSVSVVETWKWVVKSVRGGGRRRPSISPIPAVDSRCEEIFSLSWPTPYFFSFFVSVSMVGIFYESVRRPPCYHPHSRIILFFLIYSLSYYHSKFSRQFHLIKYFRCQRFFPLESGKIWWSLFSAVSLFAVQSVWKWRQQPAAVCERWRPPSGCNGRNVLSP